MGFSRQGYWSGLPFPSPGDLPDPGIKPWSPSLQADSLLSEPLGEPKKFVLYYLSILCPWGFSRHEYWSGLPCPFPGDLPNPGVEPRSPALQADSLPAEPPGKPPSPRGLRSSWLPLPKKQLGIPVDKDPTVCLHLTRTTTLPDGGPHPSSRRGRK